MDNAAQARRFLEEGPLDGPDDGRRPTLPEDEVDGAGEGARAGERPAGDENALLDGCRRGDVAAFERLYSLHGERMKSVARNLLGRDSDAEDAVQETFLKVYRGAASFRGGAALSTWMYRILINNCYDSLRRRQRRSEEPIEPPERPDAAPAPAASVAAEDHPLRLAIEQSLEKIAPRQRTVFLLSAVEGFSHREIAQVLDVSEGASRTLLFEAKRRLQELLGSRAAGQGSAS